MTLKDSILPVLTLALFAFTVSCAKQTDYSDPEDGGLSIEFALAQETLTKTPEPGDDALHENLVATLDVFIYQDGREDCIHYQRITPVSGMTRYGLAKKQSDFTADTPYTVYVVANGKAASDGAKTLAQLKQAMVGEALNPDAVQASLLMDGKSRSTVLNDGTKANKNIEVSLKRAVAKIRINLSYGTGYQPVGQVTKKLVNYASDARILESGDAHSPSLASTSMYTAAGTVSGTPGQIVLYSYSNDWNVSVANETFVYLNVPVQKGPSTVNQYYKIPVNYRLSASGGDPGHLYRLRRNYIYDITIF